MGKNTYDLTGEYGIGYTKKKEEFYFDLEDYDKIKNYTWYLDDVGYMRTNTKDKQHLRMHKLLTCTGKDIIVDHENRNKTGNRKINLRMSNRSGNGSNKNVQSNNTSGVIGVYFDKKRSKWEVKINDSKNHVKFGGYFIDVNHAIKKDYS